MRYTPRGSFPLKRFERLRKCESVLIKRLAANAGDRELLHAAEQVREAQHMVLKGLRHDREEGADRRRMNSTLLEKIDAATAEWAEKTLTEIVAMYRRKKVSHDKPLPAREWVLALRRR